MGRGTQVVRQSRDGSSANAANVITDRDRRLRSGFLSGAGLEILADEHRMSVGEVADRLFAMRVISERERNAAHHRDAAKGNCSWEAPSFIGELLREPDRALEEAAAPAPIEVRHQKPRTQKSGSSTTRGIGGKTRVDYERVAELLMNTRMPVALIAEEMGVTPTIIYSKAREMRANGIEIPEREHTPAGHGVARARKGTNAIVEGPGGLLYHHLGDGTEISARTARYLFGDDSTNNFHSGEGQEGEGSSGRGLSRKERLAIFKGKEGVGAAPETSRVNPEVERCEQRLKDLKDDALALMDAKNPSYEVLRRIVELQFLAREEATWLRNHYARGHANIARANELMLEMRQLGEAIVSRGAELRKRQQGMA